MPLLEGLTKNVLCDYQMSSSLSQIDTAERRMICRISCTHKFTILFFSCYHNGCPLEEIKYEICDHYTTRHAQIEGKRTFIFALSVRSMRTCRHIP